MKGSGRVDRAERRPGGRLRALGSRLCSPRALERLIDPAIADLQSEHAQAVRAGRVWRGRWIRVAGTLAFWKVIGFHAATRAVPIAREWAAADGHALGRTATFAATASVVVTIPFVLVPLSHLHTAMSTVHSIALVAFIVPQALPISVPIGLAFGILFGVRQATATARVRRSILAITIVCSGIMFIVLGWIVPETNQAFRELSAARRVMRGVNELTLGELWGRGLWLPLHIRVALAASPLILGLFAFSIAAAAKARSRALVVGLAAVVGYYSCLWILVAPAAELAPWPAAQAVWTPNLIFAIATAGLLLLRSAKS